MNWDSIRWAYTRALFMVIFEWRTKHSIFGYTTVLGSVARHSPLTWCWPTTTHKEPSSTEETEMSHQRKSSEEWHYGMYVLQHACNHTCYHTGLLSTEESPASLTVTIPACRCCRAAGICRKGVIDQGQKYDCASIDMLSLFIVLCIILCHSEQFTKDLDEVMSNYVGHKPFMWV